MIYITLGLLHTGVAWSQSNITDVLIYRDRAEITRTQKTTCTSGFAEIQFEQIPATVDQRSIRAVTKADRTEVVGVTSKMFPSVVIVDETEKELRSKQKELQNKIQIEKTAVTNISSEQRQIGQYENMFYQILQEEMRNTKASTSKWKSSLDAFQNHYQKLDQKRQIREVEIRRLQRKLNLVTKQLQRRGTTEQKSSVTASVRVNCKKQSSSSVFLTYIVPNATWRPEYDLHFGKSNSDSKDLTLITSAIIRQSTGENWKNARITLTTAKPNLGSTPPYPRPIYVNGQERTTDKFLVEGEENRSTFTAGSDQNQSLSYSDLSSAGQNYTFTLPSQNQVFLSNGQEHWVPLDEQMGKGMVNNIVVPKVSPLVFEGVSTNNPAPYALLTGNVHIHNSGSYMGTHPISYTGAGEPIELAIAHKPELKVKRSTLHDMKKSKLLGKNKVIQRAYEIKVTNNSNEIQSLVIRENIPVSKHEDLKINIGEDTTSKYIFDEEQGFVTWNTEIKAQETSTFVLYYEVTIPSDWDM
jgi:uncharacterized protein (TIGR02231 family)